jgi:gluconolactonase
MLSLKRTSIFCDGLDHPECVAVHPDGSVWAGGEAGQIYRISANGKRLEQVADTGGFVLGIAFSPDASWMAICDLKQKCLFALDVSGRTLSEFARGADGVSFNIPNHLVFADDGSLFVTDSGAFREVSGKIFRFSASGAGEIWHAGPFNFANGITIGPDNTIYVVCTWLPGVERVEFRPDGSAGRRSVYCRLPKALPDGLAFDARGNLYVSCYTPARIYKVTPAGKVSVLIDDWEAHTLSNPTNIAFGGKNFDQLLAANLGRWHITNIDLGVRGAPLACHRHRPSAAAAAALGGMGGRTTRRISPAEVR